MKRTLDAICIVFNNNNPYNRFTKVVITKIAKKFEDYGISYFRPKDRKSEYKQR